MQDEYLFLGLNRFPKDLRFTFPGKVVSDCLVLDASGAKKTKEDRTNNKNNTPHAKFDPENKRRIMAQ